ncbi:CLUMA_CG008131, isoform A [Clunio marinus]|uniref:CLUMA_CG008131, isoform A n=1 Tax=Clunio marinus TaxID=568069 RepID=A0A1J1I2Q4_9DIPT|nr:CLUMA_CG008131, isoform A [Clunio marinus]
MCFISYWTGNATKNGLSGRKIKKKKIIKEQLIQKYYKVVAIHKRQDLLDDTIRLINSHWPKSRSERLSILGASKDDLPISLIVTFKEKLCDDSEESKSLSFNEILLEAQEIIPTKVLGHLRLVPVPADEKACFIESMVVHRDYRGNGIGSFFIQEAEKFCEEVLHLKSIFLSTYDSGEFYMKIGFQLTKAICVYGNGELNTVTKKIFLKKELNYVEPEEVEEVIVDTYDPNKDYNYKQQQLIESDVILSGFPFKLQQPKGIVGKLCELIDFPSSAIRYFYMFEFANRKSGERSFHMIISTYSIEIKNELMTKLDNFGVLCFQNFFDKPVNEYDNTLITHQRRYTNLNYAISKIMQELLEDSFISEFKYENFQFRAKQCDEWIVVRNLEVIEQIKTVRLPENIIDKETGEWDFIEEEDKVEKNLRKLREHFKMKVNEDWWPSVRRPSEIILEHFD